MIFFRDIIGQQNAREQLQYSFACDRLNHSYLLEGPSGTGRYSLALALGARYLCHNPKDNDACGECKSCLMFAAGTHPDFLELPRDCRNLGINRFAEREGADDPGHLPVLSFMRLKPMLENGRVCLIPDAERMNEQAANAFLKTLEEPPSGTLIILTASARDRLIGTIVSRCRRLGLSPLGEKEITEELVKREVASREDAAAMARLAEGSLGAALEFGEGEALEHWRWLDGRLKELTPAGAVELGEGIAAKVKECKNGDSKRQTLLAFLDMLALAVRLRLRKGEVAPLSASKSLGALWQAGERLAANVRPELVAYSAALDTVSALRA